MSCLLLFPLLCPTTLTHFSALAMHTKQCCQACQMLSCKRGQTLSCRVALAVLSESKVGERTTPTKQALTTRNELAGRVEAAQQDQRGLHRIIPRSTRATVEAHTQLQTGNKEIFHLPLYGKKNQPGVLLPFLLPLLLLPVLLLLYCF